MFRWGLSWMLALFLIAIFLLLADQIAFPSSNERNVVFPLLAEYSGMPVWEPTGRLATAALQVAAALLLILPLTRRAGAILGVLIAAAAIAVQVLWLGLSVPVERGSQAMDEGQLFYLTLGLFALSLSLALIHPGREPKYSGP
jgi:hypothetical protein